MKMDRRKFLKEAGLGSIALGSLPVLAGTLARPVWAADETNFRFLSVSQAKTIGGVQHRVSISGDGKITSEEVVGGGSFNHFDNARLPSRRPSSRSGPGRPSIWSAST